MPGGVKTSSFCSVGGAKNLQRELSRVVYDLAATPSATPQQIAAAAAAACVLFSAADELFPASLRLPLQTTNV